MTAPRYPDDRIRAVVLEQLERHGPCHDELIADLAAHRLVDDEKDRAAIADAAEQCREWMARAHVEGGA